MNGMNWYGITDGGIFGKAVDYLTVEWLWDLDDPFIRVQGLRIKLINALDGFFPATGAPDLNLPSKSLIEIFWFAIPHQ